MKSDKQRLKVYSVRADEDAMKLALFYKIDLAVLFRKALEDALTKKQGKCPTCGQKMKWEKA